MITSCFPHSMALSCGPNVSSSATTGSLKPTQIPAESTWSLYREISGYSLGHMPGLIGHAFPSTPGATLKQPTSGEPWKPMPAIIRNCGFMWNYPPFEPKLWILYEVAEYSLTCEGGIEVTEDNKQFVDHVNEMREVGVRATLNKHGYKCKEERDKKFLPAWLELLVLLKRLLIDLGDIRGILDNLTWFPVTGTMLINTLNGTVKLYPFEGTLILGGEEYTFTPFPLWVSFIRS